MRVGDRTVGEGSPVFFIGEIGINHNGSLELAQRIIDMAVLCGVNVVKFQKRDPELAVPAHMRDQPRETPWGEMSYLDYKRRLEFGRTEYDALDAYCRERGVLWTASPWDLTSAEFVESYETQGEGVIAVGYSNGAEVLINRTDDPVRIRGVQVRPRDFKVKQ